MTASAYLWVATTEFGLQEVPVSDDILFKYSLPTALPSDPVLREFFPEFVTRWLADIASQWPDIKARRDDVELRRFGHTIRGSFIQFGLRDMSEGGVRIMECAARSSWDEAGAIVHHIQRALLDVQSILPTLLSKDSQ
jgi:hypothetical protein